VLAAIALVAGAAASAAAQGPIQLAGKVVRVAGSDSVVISGVPVSAHRIGKALQGVVDSAKTGAAGTFRFRLPGDTSAIYLVSARFGGVEYFSEPIRAPGATGLVIVVSDTSSAAPVRLSARHVIVSRPDPTGARAILDLFTLANASTLTRVSPDTTVPSWRVVLPAGALEPAVEEGDVSAAAVAFHGDTLLLFAPVAPGVKRMMLSYRLPVAASRAEWTAPADSFDLLVEEGSATVSGAGLEPAPPVTLMERELRRWSATPPTGPVGEVRFASPAGSARGPLWALVGIVAVIVVGGGALVLRRRPREAPRRAVPPGDLIGQLARLDAEFAGRQGEVPTAAWEAYQAERSRLKQAAESAALARRRPAP